MKYIVLKLLSGNIVSQDSYITNYLNEHGCVQLDEIPLNSKYLIICNIQNVSWYSIINKNQIPTKLLNDICSKNALLIFTTESESFSVVPKFVKFKLSTKNNDSNILNHIKHAADFFKINPKNIIYTDSNYKINFLFKKHNLTGFWINIWERFYQPLNYDYIIKNIKNKKIRDKKFLYFGGKNREHRLQFVNELLKIPDFQDNSYMSTGSGNFIDFFTKENKNIKSIILDKINVNSLSESDATSKVEHFFYNSYINIIPSSTFYTQHYHFEVTEKFFKPIVMMNPFIILGEPHSLKMLHELGYKTFDPWIDESYDKTFDDKERFIKVLNEVKRLNELTHEQLNDMFIEMLPILEHNQQLQASKYIEKDYTLYNQIKAVFDQL